jgi:hypothetical protein
VNYLKLLFLILSSPFILSSVIILSIFGAQAKLSNLKIDLFEQTMHSSELHDPNSEECEGMEFNSAEEAFLYARQIYRTEGSEEAIAACTCAIQLDPQMVKAYLLRANHFALTPGQEQRGIEDSRRAAEIFRAQGNREGAQVAEQQAETIQRVIEERERGLALREHYGIEATSEVDENWRREVRANSTLPWSEKRGLESIDHAHRSILVRVPLDVLSVALEDRAIASQQDVLDAEVEVSGPSAFAYQIPGQGWSVVTVLLQIPRKDEQSLSLSLPYPAIPKISSINLA